MTHPNESENIMASTNSKTRKRKGRDPLPKHFGSIDEAAEFWETHDSADYNEYFTPVDVEVDIERTRSIAIDGKLFNKVRAVAKKKRVTTDKLVSRWIEEKLRTAA